MKQFLNITIFVLCSVLFFLSVHAAHAEPISLKLSPSLIQIRAKSPADIQSPITIENQGNESVNVNILVKPFHPNSNENGQVEFGNANDQIPPLLKKIEIVDNTFAIHTLSLGPKEIKKLSLRLSVSKNESDSDYYFSVLFVAHQTDNNNGSSDSTSQEKNTSSTIQAVVATNVLLSIGSQYQAEGSIEEFIAPVYTQAGPVPFTIRVKNLGKNFFSPKGVILINNMFGQTVGRIDVRPAAILAGTTRALTDSSNSIKEQNQLLQQAPAAIWPEKVLFGFYTATLTLAVSDNGTIYTRTIDFFALPSTFLLILLVVTVVIIFLYFRVKAKLASQ